MGNCKICFDSIAIRGINSLINRKNICQKCYNELDFINMKQKDNDIEIRCLFEYNPFLQKMIYQFKGCYDLELSDVFLSRVKWMLKIIYFGYYIVPVPSYLDSDKVRGFNHVEEIFSSLRLPFIKCLKKTKDIKQSNMTKKERKGIKECLVIENGDQIRGKKILIVDDIYTTGSTINGCIDLVKKHRPKVLKCLVLSKKMSKL